MKHPRALCALIIVMTAPLLSAAEPIAGRQTTQAATVQVEFTYRYLLTLPDGFEPDSPLRWPLLVFLHGKGERGEDLSLVRKHGVPREIDHGRQLPFVVLAPQCPDDEWWNLPAIEALITDVVRRYQIDPDRIYLTGLSMGGFGTWALAARHPERYAAIIPICGGGETKWAPKLRDLPVWAFHGALDQVVPLKRSQDMIDAITAAGGSPKLTVYPNAAHDSWTETYANDEIYTWLLAHRRGK
ncbi:MAG: prolyl oligopeptidase family serine peptidase [Opitutaceae bacterium]